MDSQVAGAKPMKKSIQAVTGNFFKDSDGSIVLWQRPNIPLLGWLVFKLISIFLQAGAAKNAFENLSMLLLFTWAYLEITSGKTYFRRVLGGSVMLGTVIGCFMK